ncbi:DUF4364 family protein [Sulfurisphaera javensis]|uniref:DUF4364 family protein n=1 Tax=Sulfurisphaera javensis TaxID=2049879 RepID=A0AAT9GSS0_9CREN
MSKRVKRSSLEILFSILNACNENVTKTRIMYASGINLIELNRYLKFLEEEGYITKEKTEKNPKYSLTEKGKDALERLRKYVEVLKEYEKEKKNVSDLIKLIKTKKKAKTSTDMKRNQSL